MVSRGDIDVTFDFRRDTPVGGDPDALSPTLRRYHRLLWSKTLPCGVAFELDDTTPAAYLCHRSNIGDFVLASDSVIPSFRKEPRLAAIISLIPVDEWEAFMRITYTMGGMMVFPANRVDGKMTINGARGFHPRVKDRFDLTLECIRRHYRHERSPLSDTLARYTGFFALFESFQGYVDYFLLQDLVRQDYSAVRFFTPFEDFTVSPLPDSVEAYNRYRQRAVEFVSARNERILRRPRSACDKP